MYLSCTLDVCFNVFRAARVFFSGNQGVSTASQLFGTSQIIDWQLGRETILLLFLLRSKLIDNRKQQEGEEGRGGREEGRGTRGREKAFRRRHSPTTLCHSRDSSLLLPLRFATTTSALIDAAPP